ncbi:MAG: hypothetical protein Q4B78_00530 [Bacillota bacterium]|nr:hypothetical protein [Bacillota bacterium]
MNKSDFKIIEGGLIADISKCEKVFSSAYVTNTRLMGVLAIYIHWLIPDGPCSELHQLFYIDCEENGLETCTVHRGKRTGSFNRLEQSMVGGLGGFKLPISKRKVMWLLQHWKEFNEKHSLPLPSGYEDYSFLFDKKISLSKAEKRKLIEDITVPMINDYGVVNYFLMRCFGHDYEGASYLTNPSQEGRLVGDFPLNLYDAYEKATFLRNTIDLDKRYGDGSISYLCESLIESNGNHEILVSKVVVKDLTVIGFEHCSGFSISTTEAAMILAKQEYFVLYDIHMLPRELDDNIGEFVLGLDTVLIPHSNGKLFVSYKKNNSHVNEQIYELSNDINGFYFLTDIGQLVIMAHSREDVRELEYKFIETPIWDRTQYVTSYHFYQATFFDFIDSPFMDFKEYVDFVSEEI